LGLKLELALHNVVGEYGWAGSRVVSVLGQHLCMFTLKPFLLDVRVGGLA